MLDLREEQRAYLMKKGTRSNERTGEVRTPRQRHRSEMGEEWQWKESPVGREKLG